MYSRFMPYCNFQRATAHPPASARPVPARRAAAWGALAAPLRAMLRALLRALVCAPLLLWLLAAAHPAAAAEPDRWAALTHTAFKHHTALDLGGGLCFAQDRAGFVWIGTQSGLVRWDGNRARKFVADPMRDDALPDNYIMSMLVDARGRLWAGTSSGGLVRYDAARENFVRYPAGPGGLGNAQVTALADDGAGGVWVGTGSGLDHIDARGAVTRGAAAGPLDARAVPARAVGALLRAGRDTLWIGTREGLLRLERGATAPVAVALEGRADGGANVSALMQDSAGRIWIGTRSHGAFVIEPGGGAARAVREGGPAPTLDRERVTAIVEAGLGEVWLGTDGANGGIVAVDPLLGTTRRIRHQPDTPDSLYENDILAMFRERSGIVFAATMGALSQHDPLPRAVTTIRATGGGAANKLSVPSMLAHPDGRLWLGVVGGGVDIVEPQRGAVTHLTPAPPGTPGALPTGRVLGMAVGRGGTVYLGTEQGLYRADAGGANVRRLAVPRRRPEAAVWALALVGEVLWVGGMDGLWALSVPPDAAGGPLALLRHERQSLGDARVTYLLPAAGGIWVGTRVGLARVADGGGVELVPTALAEADRLPPGYVSSMLLDRRGRLWLSQFGTGVAILARTDADGRRRFRRLGTAQGLEDSGANMLLEDAAGAIWASTDANLARIDPRSFAIDTFGPADGVHIPTYWTASGARTAAGELVFGGLSGVTVLRPERLSPWHYRPPVVATRILVNDREIPSGRYNPDRDEGGGGGGKAAPIEVAPEARGRGFSLEFASLDYSAPERNRYAYRLAGFDPDWIKADATSRRVSYTNLPPGDYLLQLRGSNRNGDWSAPLEVPVRVLPAWHQRPLARIGAGLLAVALLVALVHARTTLLRRRQRELVAMVDARTAELRATQSQLEQLAYGDPLTGLANRRLFNDELRHLVAQAARGGPGFTLLLIDLDHFKQINDTLGHDAGDALLVAAAARLRAAVRESDRPFRLGGDEFAVLLGQTTARATIEPVCLRILEHMAQPLPHGAATMRISASVGAAVHGGGDGAHEELYKRADVALYRAKAAGRDTWRLAVDD